jgi:hypothetical protein
VAKASKHDTLAAEDVVDRCYHCNGPTRYKLPRFEHDGKVDTFHDVCVGVWLMQNPDSVIFFVTGGV